MKGLIISVFKLNFSTFPNDESDIIALKLSCYDKSEQSSNYPKIPIILFIMSA